MPDGPFKGLRGEVNACPNNERIGSPLETELLHDQNITNEAYTFLGNVTGYTPVERGIEVAAGDARLRILVLSPRIVRVRAVPNGDFLPRRPWAPDRPPAEWPGASFTIAETPDHITLDTGVVVVEVQRNPARVRFVDRSGHSFAADDPASGYGWRTQSEARFLGRPGDDVLGTLVCRKTLPAGEYYYGFGERTGLLEKRGTRYSHWTTDSWDHSSNTDVMYQAIPFFLALQPDNALAYGIYLNNTFRSAFDMGYLDRQLYQLEAQSGELDYYLIYGPTPAEVLSGYTEILGRMPLPPRWALGFQQSRWSYYPESAVRAVADGYRSRGIPAEVIHLDIDYMRGYRDFTWDPERFPDPRRMIADLRSQGFRVVTIIDPGIKYEPGTPFFDEAVKQGHFLRDADGELAHGEVWPGDCVFPDFARAETRAWWGDQHKSLLDAGVSGIWNDMNEPAAGSKELPTDAPTGDDDTRPATFAETHNLYGYLEARATHEAQRRLQPDERPFLLTRSGFAGIQRYSAVWTGDNASSWEHLEMSLPSLSNLSLSGVAFCGADIGGFWRNATPELFARWVEIGALSPFSRAHTANGTAPHEPWAFGPEVEAIARRYIELRYRLLPHLYTLFHEAATTGAPIWRPLVYAYPTDPHVTRLHDQVLLGSDLLLAPVYRPGVSERRVYLPSGIWRDYWTGECLSGGQSLLAHAPLDVLPIYVREGSIIPTGPTLHYSDERPLDHLTLDIYAGDETLEASGALYEDDGHTMAYQQGAHRTTRYHYHRDGQTATLSATTGGGGYTPVARRLTLRFHGPAIHAAHLDGADNASLLASITSTTAGAETIHTVEIPTDPGAWTLTIEHPNPNG